MEELLDLADRLPAEVAAEIAAGLVEAGRALSPPEVADIIGREIPNGPRGSLARLLPLWRDRFPRREWSELASALVAAQAATDRVRCSSTQELVWTGPDPKPRRLRLTEPVLFEIVAAAERELLLVSYTVSRMQELGSALSRAAARGVGITLALEGWDGTEDPIPRLAEFGTDPRSYARVLTWPDDARTVEGKPAYARLHAKCVVADRRLALVTSANLSQAAHRTNMELGVRISGGPLPGQIVEHFEGLEAAGSLRRIG